MGCFSSNTRETQKSPQIQPQKSKKKQSEIIDSANLRIDASSFVGRRRGQLRDQYTIGAKLGSGAFGFVRLGSHKTTGQKRAIKTIQKESIVRDIEQRAKFFSEVDILRKADHPNIVRLYEFFQDDKYYHLVTEYVPGGELFDYIIKSKMLSEPIAANFMRQILSAVAYCHANNIVHRDLKPENLLLDKESHDATVKVIDFGTSTVHDNQQNLTQRYGTAYYIAPEVLQKDYNEKCDIWSCGVILYILLSGKPPFYGRQDRDILRRVNKGEYSLKGPEWENISQGAKNFIGKMLDYNPRTRISASKAMNIQADPASANLAVSTLENLQSFRAEQKIQHAVLTYIASQLLSKEESKKLTETFRKIDKNGDGKLSREELLEAYSTTIGLDAAMQEVERIMRDVDVNNSGFIDYTEFIMASTQRDVLLSKSNLDAAFKAFDADGSGKISAQELKDILGGLEGESNENMWQELIQEVDQNGDGEIDINEFKQMMMVMFNTGE